MEQNIKPQRINVVDSLRGFAVVGIIIIHFLEHLNFYAFPEPTAFDQGLWYTVFYIGASKMRLKTECHIGRNEDSVSLYLEVLGMYHIASAYPLSESFFKSLQ